MNSCSAEIFVHIFTAHCPYQTLAKLRKPWVVVLDLPWMISSLNLSLLFYFLSCWFLDSEISFQLSAMVRLRWAWRLFSCQGSGIRPAFHSSSLSFFPLIFILRSLSTKTTNGGTDTDLFILRLWFPKDFKIGVDQCISSIEECIISSPCKWGASGGLLSIGWASRSISSGADQHCQWGSCATRVLCQNSRRQDLTGLKIQKYKTNYTTCVRLVKRT